MARYRATVISTRSAEETFDYLADFSNAAVWDPGTATAERLDGGPVGLGAAFRLGVRVGARVVTLDYRTVAYDRPHRFVVLAESGTIRSKDTVTVTAAADGGAIVSYEADLRLKGALAAANAVLPVALERVGARGGVRSATRTRRPPVPRDRPQAGPFVARGVDGALEATVAGSFTSIGPVVRARTAGWTPPPSLAGRTALVTGAGSGVGLAAACGMARLGARVVLTARSEDRAGRAVEVVRRAAPAADVSHLLADMGEFDEVRALAERFLADGDRLDVLVHNAGALARNRQVTSSGLEVTVASQVAGPYLLTGLLLPALRTAGARRGSSRCPREGCTPSGSTSTPSRWARSGTTGRWPTPRAKRAQLVLMHEWVRRTPGTGICFHAMHPGWTDTPGLRDSLPRFARTVGPVLRSPDQGADTVVWLAAAPSGVETTGGFWLDRRRRWEHRVPWTRLSEEEFHDAGAALWAWCAERTGWDGPTRPV